MRPPPKLKGFISSIRGYKAFVDWEKGKGDPFSYYVYEAACSEIETDRLTGAHKVSRLTAFLLASKNNSNKIMFTLIAQFHYVILVQ